MEGDNLEVSTHGGGYIPALSKKKCLDTYLEGIQILALAWEGLEDPRSEAFGDSHGRLLSHR